MNLIPHQANGDISFNILADIESQAITLMKDRDGFIWIGSYVDGLYRYDGKKLTHYLQSSGLITSNNISAMIEDREGILWFAASGGGLSRYDKESNQITHYRHDPDNPNSLSSQNIFWSGKQVLMEDTKNHIWLGTIGGGVNCLDKSTGNVMRFQHDKKDPASLGNDNIRSLYTDRQGNVWVGTEDGLDLFLPETGTFKHYQPTLGDMTSLSDKIISFIFEDTKERFWIGTESGGLNQMNRETGRFRHFRHDPNNEHSIRNNRTVYIYEHFNGELWICHETEASIFDPDKEIFRSFKGHPSDITMMFSEPDTAMVWTLYDRGTLGNNHWASSRFRTYLNDPQDSNTLASDIVVTIYEDSREVLWISCLGGLTRYDPKKNQYTNYFHTSGDPATLPSKSNYSPGIYEDREGHFWIGNAVPASLSLFDRDTGQVIKSYLPDPGDPHAIPDAQQVNQVVEDKEYPNILWLPTFKGLVKFDKRTERFTRFGRNNIWYVLQDQPGRLLASTWGNGLAIFNKKTHEFEYLRHDPENPKSISGNLTIPIFRGVDGMIWVGAENGLNLFHPDTNTFTSYGRHNGFPWDALHSIGEDRQGSLWLGTNKGLVKFNPETKVYRIYLKGDGLPGNLFYAHNGIRTRDGRLWFGGPKGMINFLPEALKDNPHVPEIRFTALKQSGEPLELNQAPERVQELTLDWQKNFLEFEFIAFDYVNPEKNQYAYTLEGLDKAWFYSGERNFGRYAGLPPGEYTLKIKGSNNDGVWNENGQSLRIRVLPPFWRTGWFFALILTAIAGLLWVMKRLSDEQNKNRRELKESEEKYRDLFNNLPDIFFRADDRGRLVMVSPSIKKILGYTVDEAMGLSVATDLSVDATRWESLLNILDKKGTVQEFETGLKRKDGNIIWVSINCRRYDDHSDPCPIRNSHRESSEKEYRVNFDPVPKRAGVQGIIRDITLKKHSAEEQKRLTTVIEQAAEIIVITDPKGVIQYANPAFESITGYPREDAIGKTSRILKSGHHNQAFYKTLWDTISSGKVWKGRFTNARKDGSLFREDATISPIRDASGHIINYAAVKRDITREVALENQLIQAQKMESIGTLAGGIAHDFNNILSAILGYSELIQLSTSPNSQISSYLEKIFIAGHRAKDLIQQILTFSRQTEQESKPVSVKAITIEALKLLRASLPSTIDIHQKLESDSRVMGDATQIHQIIMNLCTNAGHAMQENGGTLEVKLVDTVLDSHFTSRYPNLRPGHYLNLNINDTGEGIPADTLERIFEPFFTTKGQGVGTGMGLAVVHGIVKRCGGMIYAYSQVGIGTSFKVFLPIIQREVETEHDQPIDEHLPHGTERILLVDDEPDLIEIGTILLESLGYEVVGESSSVSALATFAAAPSRFDLVMTDLTMPQMTGDQLAEKLIAIQNEIPILLCTGFIDRSTEDKIRKKGIQGVLMKPIARLQLAKMVRHVLDASIENG